MASQKTNQYTCARTCMYTVVHTTVLSWDVDCECSFHQINSSYLSPLYPTGSRLGQGVPKLFQEYSSNCGLCPRRDKCPSPRCFSKGNEGSKLTAGKNIVQILGAHVTER